MRVKIGQDLFCEVQRLEFGGEGGDGEGQPEKLKSLGIAKPTENTETEEKRGRRKVRNWKEEISRTLTDKARQKLAHV